MRGLLFSLPFPDMKTTWARFAKMINKAKEMIIEQHYPMFYHGFTKKIKVQIELSWIFIKMYFQKKRYQLILSKFPTE